MIRDAKAASSERDGLAEGKSGVGLGAIVNIKLVEKLVCVGQCTKEIRLVLAIEYVEHTKLGHAAKQGQRVEQSD